MSSTHVDTVAAPPSEQNQRPCASWLSVVVRVRPNLIRLVYCTTDIIILHTIFEANIIFDFMDYSPWSERKLIVPNLKAGKKEQNLQNRRGHTY